MCWLTVGIVVGVALALPTSVIALDNSALPMPPMDVASLVQAYPVEATPTPTPKPVKKVVGTSTRANNYITPEQLQTFLGTSPLAPYSAQILESPYWSTIIGICWIEEAKCTINPHGSNNFWGIMKGTGGIQSYASIPDGIKAISNLLAKYETKGYDTIEELNGYYVQPASATWLNTVKTIKAQLENEKGT